jgi:hypothetical protein
LAAAEDADGCGGEDDFVIVDFQFSIFNSGDGDWGRDSLRTLLVAAWR